MRYSLILRCLSTILFVAWAIGCGSTSNGDPCYAPSGETPTAAYKRLYAAVKSKDTEAIKVEMTEDTINLASVVSQRNKTPIEKVFENGFTATTFADSLPEIRDERVNCNMGAVEVWNAKDRLWEDLPFVLVNGKWKVAFGELFKDTYRSPGKGRARKEAEAANAARANEPTVNSNVNTNNPVPAPDPRNANGPQKK